MTCDALDRYNAHVLHGEDDLDGQARPSLEASTSSSDRHCLRQIGQTGQRQLTGIDRCRCCRRRECGSLWSVQICIKDSGEGHCFAIRCIEQDRSDDWEDQVHAVHGGHIIIDSGQL